MAKSKKGPNLKSFIVNTLRRASFRWPGRGEAMRAARVDRGQYQCAKCGPGKTYNTKEIKMDHIIPVVDPEKGFTTWEDFINRMFCDANGYQALCNTCHDEKTDAEDAVRKQTRIAQNLEKLKKKSNN